MILGNTLTSWALLLRATSVLTTSSTCLLLVRRLASQHARMHAHSIVFEQALVTVQGSSNKHQTHKQCQAAAKFFLSYIVGSMSGTMYMYCCCASCAAARVCNMRVHCAVTAANTLTAAAAD
eukprot:19895-Heterococcus_DN1.PRE.3